MTGNDWAPAADVPMLRRRAAALARIRAFFAARGVLEVETPLLVRSAVSDPNIGSIAVASPTGGFLHTSPEYAMKRLLAAGCPDIWQLCRAFREGERGRLHNPEFTILEWYRRGFSLAQLMQETADCALDVLGATRAERPVELLDYGTALRREAGVDPYADPDARLRDCAGAHGLHGHGLAGATRDELLDFLAGVVVGPRLGHGALTCLHHYPASQAALAALDPDQPGTALRFELYADGIELANGFVELADAGEQARRFGADLAERRRRGLPEHAGDERLLAALQAGLPPCAGVALGFDRLLMVASGAANIDEVLAFPVERA